MEKKIILCGYGTVGKEFIRLIKEKKELLNKEYNLKLVLSSVIGSKGTIYDEDGLDLELLLSLDKGSKGIIEYGKIKPESFHSEPVLKGDILVEATATNIIDGEPALSNMLEAISKGINIVALSKGALVTKFSEIMALAKVYGVKVKYSGATAAALPTMDIGQYSLAGTEIKSIEGILNGTTNYILTEMYEKDISFDEALKEAKLKGIAETNSDFDIKGIDSACKILLLSNSFFKTNYSLEDINIEGIDNISREKVKEVKEKGLVWKLIAKTYKENNNIITEVKPRAISKKSLLASVNGTNKGVVFNTDTMGEVCALGGASNPIGAAAAALKDIINICR